jgi:hypothetical protein
MSDAAAAGWDEVVALEAGPAGAGPVLAAEVAEFGSTADWAGAAVWAGAPVELVDVAGGSGITVSATGRTAASVAWTASAPAWVASGAVETATGDDCLTAI